MQISDNHWLYQLKADIQKIEPTAQLILYGSRARGDAKPDSDWDLLLLTDKPKLSFEERMKIIRPITLMELELEAVLSLQIFNHEEWNTKFRVTPYFQNAQQEGILV